MDNIIAFFIKQKKLALAFTLSLIFVGLIVSFDIQKDQFPNVDLETMIVSAYYPGNSPEDVELDITNKLEEEIDDVSGIKAFTSTSKEGFMNITVEIEPDLKDIQTTKQAIRDAVNRVQDLPDDLDDLPQVVDAQPIRDTILQINLVDKKASYQDMRMLVNHLEKELKELDGVAEVEKSGYLKQEIKIYLNEEKLLQHQLSLSQVIKAIANKNLRYTAGKSDSTTNQRNFVVLSKFSTPEQVADVIVSSSFDGPEISLKDIAEIVIDNEEEQSITRVNGKKGFILRIKKQTNADIIKTVDLIKKEISQQQQFLSKSLEVFYTDDSSYYVRNRLSIVSNNGLIGLGLILIVLSVFLSTRSAFWVAMSLPVVIFGMVVLLKLSSETINLVSLAAVILVLGLVVDDSIIMAESIHHHRNRMQNRYQAALIGFKRVIKPVLTTMLTTVLAFSSMFLMSGTLGKFIYIMPLVVIFALIISFFEIVVALPAHLAGSKVDKERLWFIPFERFFNRISEKLLAYRYLVIIAFMLIFAFSVWLGSQMRFSLFPEAGADKINAKIELTPGYSLQATEEKTKQLEQIIINTIGDELDSLSAEVGNNFDHIARLEITLKPASSRSSTGREIYSRLKQAVKKDGSDLGAVQFFIRHPGPPVGSDIEINLVSSNDKQRRRAADELIRILQTKPGVTDLDRDDQLGKKRIEVLLNYSQIGRLGLDLAVIRSYLKASLDGIEASDYRDGLDEVDFTVFLGRNKDIIDLKIPNEQGLLVPITKFATLNYIEGEANYNHYNGRRAVRISGSVDDKQASSHVVITSALKDLDLINRFSDVAAVLSGGSDDHIKSMQDFGKAFAISILGIYLLLMLLFNSYTQPLMIVLTIPLSIVGVVIAFFLHGHSLSFFAILGALALVGVIVNDGLILVNHLNFLAKKQKININQQSTKERIVWIAKGAKDRLRAVVLTSLTTLAGVIPLGYGIGGIDFILQPMALALGYGLLFGTVMTLIFLPALYLINLEIRAFFIKLITKYKMVAQ